MSNYKFGSEVEVPDEHGKQKKFFILSEHVFITNPRIRILLISFAILFFELICIRWIPSYVRYLSYFTNFLLLASILGIGLGILTARRKHFWFPPFPVMLLLLIYTIIVNRYDLGIQLTQVLYFENSSPGSQESFITLP